MPLNSLKVFIHKSFTRFPFTIISDVLCNTFQICRMIKLFDLQIWYCVTVINNQWLRISIERARSWGKLRHTQYACTVLVDLRDQYNILLFYKKGHYIHWPLYKTWYIGIVFTYLMPFHIWRQYVSSQQVIELTPLHYLQMLHHSSPGSRDVYGRCSSRPCRYW